MNCPASVLAQAEAAACRAWVRGLVETAKVDEEISPALFAWRAEQECGMSVERLERLWRQATFAWLAETGQGQGD